MFREGKEGRKRERNINVWLPLTRPLLGTWSRDPWMCPDWESNKRPFGSQAGTQSTETHQPRLNIYVLKKSNFFNENFLRSSKFEACIVLVASFKNSFAYQAFHVRQSFYYEWDSPYFFHLFLSWSPKSLFSRYLPKMQTQNNDPKILEILEISFLFYDELWLYPVNLPMSSLPTLHMLEQL